MLVQAVLEHIKQIEGTEFEIRFIKRSDGSEREMKCLTGVEKKPGPEPTRKPTNWKAHDLLVVTDVAEDKVKSIPIEGMKQIKINGLWIDIEHAPRWWVTGKNTVQCLATGRMGTIDLPDNQAMSYALPINDYSRVKT